VLVGLEIQQLLGFSGDDPRHVRVGAVNGMGPEPVRHFSLATVLLEVAVDDLQASR
jgi:hypothetical protein